MRRIIKRILCVIIFLLIIGGIAVAEYFNIKTTDEDHQSELAKDIYTNISTDFYLIKSSILLQDSEEYVKYLEKANSEIQNFQQYPFIQNRDAEKIAQIQDCLQFFSDKTVMMQSITILKEYNDLLLTFINNEIPNEMDDILKEELQNLATKIGEAKFDESKIIDPDIKKISEATLSMFNSVRDTANQLADCYDSCYENEITPKIESFQEEVTTISNDIKNLNDITYQLFSVEKIDQIIELINGN